jgi:mono/diheme cytochrome c family protein
VGRASAIAPRLVPAIVTASASLVALPASAQDALRGKRLYLDAARLTGSGVSCVGCHNAYPPGGFGIAGAADRPDIIERAVHAISPMAPFRGRLTPTDYVDLAAYLGTPSVPSPAPRLSRSDGTPIVGALQFGAVAVGAHATQTVVVENVGQLGFQVLTAPVVDGADAAAFTLSDSTCAPGLLEPGQQCQLTLELAPEGTSGRRVARVVFEHDWVYGLAALALLGEAAEAPPPPPEPEPDTGGCAVGRSDATGTVASLLVVALLLGRQSGIRHRCEQRCGRPGCNATGATTLSCKLVPKELACPSYPPAHPGSSSPPGSPLARRPTRSRPRPVPSSCPPGSRSRSWGPG